MLETPPPPSAAIWRRMSGFWASSTRHFGRSSVKALMRLPRPAASMTARIILGLEKPRKQRHVIRGKRVHTFGMPHHADHTAAGVLDRLNYSIVGNCPSPEWGVNLHRSEIMKAIYFHAPAIHRNRLAGSHMSVNLFQPAAKAVENHLHSPANAQYGQVSPLGQIQKRSLGFVPFRSI